MVSRQVLTVPPQELRKRSRSVHKRRSIRFFVVSSQVGDELMYVGDYAEALWVEGAILLGL
jgi:hypothetical protein